MVSVLVVHAETFGICVVDESALEEDTTAVAPGLRYEHEAHDTTHHEVHMFECCPTDTNNWHVGE
jgi:hypothetical protein